MRYIALIALIDLILIAAWIPLVSPYAGSGLAFFGALIVCILAVPVAIIVGIPMLWIARRFAPSSAAAMGAVGAIAGLLCPLVLSLLVPIAPTAFALGAVLGLVSALLWWSLVERHPDRREYYD